MKTIEYTPMSKKDLHNIQEGDVIERMLGFQIPVYLIVKNITENTIEAGWIFDRNTGLEIDEDIPLAVSYIRKILTEEEKVIVKEKGKL
jgi:hypothetical protein